MYSQKCCGVKSSKMKFALSCGDYEIIIIKGYRLSLLFSCKCDNQDYGNFNIFQHNYSIYMRKKKTQNV